MVAASVVFAASLAACERDMTIAVVNQSNPPSFKLSGSGRLIFFSVFEVPRDRPPSIDDPKMWEIRPVDENLISKLPDITYGVVPPGFQQTFPKTGTPPLLVEGRLYEAGGPAFDANGGSIRFTIKDGKIVIVSDGHNQPQYSSTSRSRTLMLMNTTATINRPHNSGASPLISGIM